MRTLTIILGILVIFLGGGYFLAFTQSGNNILKPYIEDFVSKKIQKEVKVEKFSLKTDHLSLQVKVSNEANLIVDGDINIFKQWFDLIYQLHAQNLKTPTIIIRDKLQVQGNIKGSIDDFIAKGDGNAFGSNLNFNIHLLDKMPLDGTINAKGIETAKVLELIGKPAYTSGLVDIDAEIKNDKGELLGGVNMLINTSKIDEELILKDFNITLPKGTTYVGKIYGKVQDNNLNLTSQIVSTLATFKTTNTDINLKTSDIKSDFLLKVDKLEKLATLTKKKLFGSITVTGDIQKNGKDLVLNAKSDIFDGQFKSKLYNNALTASATNLQIKKILAFLGEPAMAYGVIDFDASVDDIKKENKNGGLNLNLKNGELVGSLMRSKFDLNFPAITNFSTSLVGKLTKDIVDLKTDFKSTLANIKAENSSINLTTNDISSDFKIDIENLNSIGRVLNQDLKGSFSINGDIKLKDNSLSFDAHTQSLGGNIDATMKNDQLNASLKDVSVERILSLLNKPIFAKGSMNAVADFSNLKENNLNGTFNYTLNNGLLLGKGLKEIANIDFPDSSPFAIKSDIDVKNGFATFINSVNSDLASLPEFKGTYDINKKLLQSKYHIDIKDLSKLAFLTKQVLNGPFQANGVINMQDENLKISAIAPILGGQSDSLFDKKILTSKANKISIKGLSELLGFPYVFDSVGDFDLNYNTTSKKGDYSLIMKEGHLVQTQLSNLVQAFTKYDITKEVYKDTILQGKIDDTKVTYTLDLNGSETSLNIPNGVYDMVTQQTKANFKFKLQKTDIDGTISGLASEPKVTIDSSKYLEKKVKDKAEKALEKHLPEDKKGVVKDLLKLF